MSVTDTQNKKSDSLLELKIFVILTRSA